MYQADVKTEQKDELQVPILGVGRQAGRGASGEGGSVGRSRAWWEVRGWGRAAD